MLKYNIIDVCKNIISMLIEYEELSDLEGSGEYRKIGNFKVIGTKQENGKIILEITKK